MIFESSVFSWDGAHGVTDLHVIEPLMDDGDSISLGFGVRGIPNGYGFSPKNHIEIFHFIRGAIRLTEQDVPGLMYRSDDGRKTICVNIC